MFSELLHGLLLQAVLGGQEAGILRLQGEAGDIFLMAGYESSYP